MDWRTGEIERLAGGKGGEAAAAAAAAKAKAAGEQPPPVGSGAVSLANTPRDGDALTEAGMNGPHGMCLDEREGCVYICAYFENCIRRLTLPLRLLRRSPY